MSSADLDEMQRSLEEARAAFAQDVEQASTAQGVEHIRVKYLGRRSLVAESMKQLGSLAPEQRATLGKFLNVVKTGFESQLAEAAQRVAAQPTSPSIDVTLPGAALAVGRLHPITRTLEDVIACFAAMGFEIVEGPEMEYEFYNFDALNIPKDHPSRESFDTFFLEAPSSPKLGKPLLRSHTSPVQIRVMQQRKPPLRIVVPGRVYRPDALDASHSFMFHQVEGLVVDARTSFADLKGTLDAVLGRLFGSPTKTRFRPHFFPFTEPSAEVDIACTACGGSGCSTCGRKGWLEIMGCGMVHPNVFKAAGYDPSMVQGFAFGMGVERIAMLRHGIRDIRMFFDNDLRFLEQF